MLLKAFALFFHPRNVGLVSCFGRCHKLGPRRSPRSDLAEMTSYAELVNPRKWTVSVWWLAPSCKDCGGSHMWKCRSRLIPDDIIIHFIQASSVLLWKGSAQRRFHSHPPLAFDPAEVVFAAGSANVVKSIIFLIWAAVCLSINMMIPWFALSIVITPRL